MDEKAMRVDLEKLVKKREEKLDSQRSLHVQAQV